MSNNTTPVSVMLASFNGSQLWPLGSTAIDTGIPHTRSLTKLISNLCNLLSQLTRWHHNQALQCIIQHYWIPLTGIKQPAISQLTDQAKTVIWCHTCTRSNEKWELAMSECYNANKSTQTISYSKYHEYNTYTPRKAVMLIIICL